jgi:methylenetetrahydrofolate--tRNA-(uracil-5-)-methyltransferase
MAARFAAAESRGETPVLPPLTTAHGALLAHVTGRLGVPGDATRDFQPMNVNFGLFPPIGQPVVDEDGKRLRGNEKTLAKKRAMSVRALRDFDAWLGESRRAAA